MGLVPTAVLVVHERIDVRSKISKSQSEKIITLSTLFKSFWLHKENPTWYQDATRQLCLPFNKVSDFEQLYLADI